MNYSGHELQICNKPAMSFGFFLNTLNKKFYFGFEHLALVGWLGKAVADGTTQCFLVIVAPYFSQQLHLTTHHTIQEYSYVVKSNPNKNFIITF